MATPSLFVRAKAQAKLVLGPSSATAGAAVPAVQCAPLDTRAEFNSGGGRVLAVVEESGVRVLDAETGAVVMSQPRPQVQAISLSPLGTFLLTWERLAEGAEEGNLKVWRVGTGTLETHYLQKVLGDKSAWPLLKWSSDEAIAYRLVNNELHFFDGQAPTQAAVHKLRVEGIKGCELAPGGAPHHVATFVPEKKGAPAVVRLWKHPDFGEGRFLISKSFFKADEVVLMWSPAGNACLVHTQTEVDKTGKSYYGETGLFFMPLEGKGSIVTLNKEGPICDVKWSPKGDEFVVVFGFSPSRTALFNAKCEMIHDFGEAPRNTVSWSPHARFLAIAGFGNLSGELSFWDRKTLKCLGTVEAHMTVNYEWSPDSKYFLTAILFPRLRVDNGYRVWSCNGNLLLEEKMEELTMATWRPLEPAQFPTPDDSAIPPKATQGAAAPKVTATAQKYVPRHLRDAAGGGGAAAKGGTRGSSLADLAAAQETHGSAAMLRPGSAPLGAEVDGGGANAAKNKAKRDAKKKKADEEKAAASAPPAKAAAAAPPAAPAAGGGADDAVAIEKKVRNVEKKLRQINELKELVAGGKTVEANQLEKIKNMHLVEAELDGLRSKLKSMEIKAEEGKWR